MTASARIAMTPTEDDEIDCEDDCEDNDGRGEGAGTGNSQQLFLCIISYQFYFISYQLHLPNTRMWWRNWASKDS